MRFATLATLSGLIAVGRTAVIDFGDLAQYKSDVGKSLQLRGESMGISGVEGKGKGLQFALSKDTLAKTKDVLTKCGQDDNKCINDVYNLLQGTELQLDSKLERRGQIAYYWRELHFGKVTSGAFFAATSYFLLASWKAKWAEHDGGINFPSIIAAQAAAAATAKAVTVSAGGKAIATHTPPPPPPTPVAGKNGPQITTLPKDESGHKKGDIVAIMDDSLAKKLKAFSHPEPLCEEGLKFDKDTTTTDKRDALPQHPAGGDLMQHGVTLGMVLCGVQNVLVNAKPGGTFGELLPFIPSLKLAPKPAAKRTRKALLGIKDFLSAYGPMPAKPDLEVESVANWVFATMMMGDEINGRTYLSTDTFDVVDAKESPTPTGTVPKPPKPTKSGCPKPLFCGWLASEEQNDCKPQFPNKNNKEKDVFGPLCQDGEHKTCPCYAPTVRAYAVMDTDTVDNMLWYKKFWNNWENSMNQDDVTCEKDFSKVAVVDWKKLYPKFCTEVKKDPKKSLEKSYTYDEAKPQRRSYPIDKRSPPINPKDYAGLQFGFKWPGGDCQKSCEDVFNNLGNGVCGTQAFMPVGGQSKRDCGEASYSISPDIKIACRHSTVKAPRGVKEAGGGKSLDDAIKQYCNDNNGKTVKKGDNVYQRYGIVELGVPERSSYWLRSAITCGDEAKINKNDCIKALSDGMAKCAKEDKDEGFTRGHAASVGCMDYSIDLNGRMDDKSPPWSLLPPKFPPPGDGGHKPKCTDYYQGTKGRTLAEKDLNDAIDYFCKNGSEVKGLGKYGAKYVNYPPEGQKKFFPDDTYKMQLTFGAVFNHEGWDSDNKKRLGWRTGPDDKDAWTPYKTTQWCDGYDWKIHKDDCTFALRRIYDGCSTKNVKEGLMGGEFTYRCVRYLTHQVNTR